MMMVTHCPSYLQLQLLLSIAQADQLPVALGPEKNPNFNNPKLKLTNKCELGQILQHLPFTNAILNFFCESSTE